MALLFIMFLPSVVNVDYHLAYSVIQFIVNALFVTTELFTIILILWMLYHDRYDRLYVIEVTMFLSLLLSLIVIYMFALSSVCIDFKYILLNFALIFVNILDFVVENITKVVKYKKDKSKTKD